MSNAYYILITKTTTCPTLATVAMLTTLATLATLAPCGMCYTCYVLYLLRLLHLLHLLRATQIDWLTHTPPLLALFYICYVWYISFTCYIIAARAIPHRLLFVTPPILSPVTLLIPFLILRLSFFFTKLISIYLSFYCVYIRTCSNIMLLKKMNLAYNSTG